MIIKGMNAMPALSKFLVLLALFLSASHSNAFTSLSSIAGNQVRVNHRFKNQPNEWIWMMCFQTTFHQRKLK
jgi:hypothetical protein